MHNPPSSSTPDAGTSPPKRSLLSRLQRRLRAMRYATARAISHRWLRPKGLGHEPVAALAGQSICYVLPHRSSGDLLVLDQVCAQLGLPPPKAAIAGLRPVQDDAYLFLNRPVGGLIKRQTMQRFPDRLLRLQDLLSEQPGAEVHLIPVNIFWSRAPGRERSIWRLMLAERWAVTGRIRKFLSGVFNRNEILAQFGTPIAMRAVLDLNMPSNRTSRRLARLLRTSFRQQRTAVIGPDLSHRRTLVSELLDSPPVVAAIAAEVARSGKPVDRIRAHARRNAMEIASDVSFRVVRFFDILLTWTWQKLYDGVRIEGLDRVKPWAEHHELVYVPCHRSHMDYLLLSYVLYYNGLSLPHIAAGRNLNLPVVGGLLRRAGAFFMRRSFKDDPLYSAVFNEYLYMVFRRGHAVEYFVEGGRSRTGRLLPARGGMLAMTLRSVLRNIGRPVAFVPVYFGYEKVVEIRSYMGELRGQAKQPETLAALFRSARRTLSQSFGQVQVSFGEPIALDKFLDTTQPTWRNDLASAADGALQAPPTPAWMHTAVADLGRQILSGINAAASITPVNLVALVLLCTPRQAMDENDLVQQLQTYLTLLGQGPGNEGLVLPTLDAAGILAQVETMELVRRQPHPLGDILGIEGNDRILLTWYRNNSIHALAMPSLIAALCMSHRQLTRARLRTLCLAVYPYLANEFYLREDGTEATRIHAWLRLLTSTGLLSQTGAGEDCVINIPEPHSDDYSRLLLLGRVIRQTLERYYLVIAVLENQGSGRVTAAALQDHCQQMAERLARLHDLNAPEFFDPSLFSGFLDELRSQDLIREDSNQLVLFDQRVDRILQEASLVIDGDFRQAVLSSRLPDALGPDLATTEAAG